MKLEFKHLLIAGGVLLVMAYLTSVEKPLVTRAVSRIVNDLF